MSKKTRVVVDYNDPAHHQYLVDIDFVGLLNKQNREKKKENQIKAERTRTREELESILNEIGADEVLYTDRQGRRWKVLQIAPDPSFTLKEELLTRALLEIGKLSGPTIAKILTASKEKTTRTPYAVVHTPKEAR